MPVLFLKEEFKTNGELIMKRNYGIDLLRIVLMFMVCMLHTLGQGGILKNCGDKTVEKAVFYLLEVICYCAVDAFAVISGYTATKKLRNHSKFVNMWFQAFFYSFVLTLILCAFSIGKWPKIGGFFKAIFPVTGGYYWYFTAYTALYFAMPVINSFILKADEAAAKRMLLIIFFLYTILGSLKDPFKTKGGYSAIWLIVLYCVGGLSKRAKIFESKKTHTLVFLWALCVLSTWALKAFAKYGILLSYISPTVLLSALLLVVIFSRLRLKGTVIKKITPLVFGIYLFQLNKIIWRYVLKGQTAFVLEKNIFVGVLYSFLIALAIFASGLAVEFFRTLLFRLFKISRLSEKIVASSKKIAGKMTVFFD